MKNFLFLFVIAGFLSCQSSQENRSVVIPPSIKNLQLPTGVFNVVTSLVLVNDSVPLYSTCVSKSVSRLGTLDWESATSYRCQTLLGYGYSYKGVAIVQAGKGVQQTQQVPINFISVRQLNKDDLSWNNNVSFIKVAPTTAIQLTGETTHQLETLLVIADQFNEDEYLNSYPPPSPHKK